MMRGILLAACVALGPTSLSTAQETDGSLDADNLPAMYIKVHIKLDGLVEGADLILVSCSLYAFSDPSKDVGYGASWLYRKTRPNDAAAFFHGEEIEGSSFDRVVSIPIRKTQTRSDDLTYWGSGDCTMYIRDDAPSGYPEFQIGGQPQECNGSTTSAYNNWLACVWPGTSPETASIHFIRPGLNDSAVDDD